MSDQDEIDCGCQEYNALSRRQFLQNTAAFSTAALFPEWLPKIVMSKGYASNRDIIVSIFQRGGADGLSLCAPISDQDYITSRPTIHIPDPQGNSATAGLQLGNTNFMFPRALNGTSTVAGLKQAFDGNDLLVVHATGQLNKSRSHFDAQRYMEVGDLMAAGKPVDPN